MADATTITESGYVGDDVETVLVHLLQNSDYDVNRAERGIVYIDEIDKIAQKAIRQALHEMFPAKVCAADTENSGRNISRCPAQRRTKTSGTKSYLGQYAQYPLYMRWCI